jgi:hypothetical protein
MSKKRLKNRQRFFLNTRMKILVASSVAFVATVLLIIYFNFFDIKNTRAFASGDYRTSGSGEWDDTEIWEVFDGETWSPALQPPGDDVRSITITADQKLVNKLAGSPHAAAWLGSLTVPPVP